MHLLENCPVPHQEFIDQEISSSVLKTLEEKGWIESREKKPTRYAWPSDLENDQDKPKLNEEQAIAIATGLHGANHSLPRRLTAVQPQPQIPLQNAAKPHQIGSLVK